MPRYPTRPVDRSHLRVEPTHQLTYRIGTFLRHRRWAAVSVVLYLFATILPSLDRFFTWDEAVFYSQSGGLAGASSRAMPLVASRELGSSALIAALRTVADGIAEVRFLWATLTFLLTLFAARRLIAHVGDRGALIFLSLYGSYWLVLAFTPAFYANALFGVVALLTVTFYLDLLRQKQGAKPVRTGVWMGLSLSGAFAMRPLETGLFVTALVLHLFLFQRNRIRDLLRPTAAAGGVALLVAGVPWIVDSRVRFGSVVERIGSAMSQPGQVQSGLRFNLDEYLGVWVGDYLAQQAFGPVPQWPRWIIYAGMLAAVGCILLALAKAGSSSLRGAAGMFLIAGWVHASFFLFWREAVADRYHFGSMIFAAALLGWSLSKLLPDHLSRRGRSIAALIAVVWLVPQIALITSYDYIRSNGSEQVARVASTMRVLANDGPCQAFSRYGAPQVEVASGCTVTSYQEWDYVLDRVAQNREQLPTFVYGPQREGHFIGLPEGWNVIPATVGDGKRHFSLAYWLPLESGAR